MAASRSPGLAIATAAAITISAGAMFVMQKEAKKTEGRASIYQDSDDTKSKTGNEHLGTTEISNVVSHGGVRAKPVVAERK
ncbi:hypothetical protein BDP27DRAFT_1330024 [Rhodocollybia butyracea]|uniref:Uncharacterized protein n=1 Tax=Rhodocollybia butyracea TaxID=206335 RepID=A0A9P5U5J8_9AGAR|nr:hypothetical protein BDP27DRAFT_1330024 [Rhodocollybia butyracea]